MDALNEITEAKEDRSTWRRFGLSIGLAVVVIALVGCALCVVAVSETLLGASGGILHWLVAVLRWPAGAVLLALAVGIVVRVAPAKHRGTRRVAQPNRLIHTAFHMDGEICRKSSLRAEIESTASSASFANIRSLMAAQDAIALVGPVHLCTPVAVSTHQGSTPP